MERLQEAGVPTHFVKELNERETLVKRVSIVPLEVIVRNISAGSFFETLWSRGRNRVCNANIRILI